MENDMLVNFYVSSHFTILIYLDSNRNVSEVQSQGTHWAINLLKPKTYIMYHQL